MEAWRNAIELMVAKERIKGSVHLHFCSPKVYQDDGGGHGQRAQASPGVLGDFLGESGVVGGGAPVQPLILDVGEAEDGEVHPGLPQQDRAHLDPLQVRHLVGTVSEIEVERVVATGGWWRKWWWWRWSRCTLPK